ncbi:MAG TPA: 2OG-Fe(II) oxygenase [Candidatus Binataceae bacterium]|nr:2OG-Fe(II) oxygenase [Candidatus Binataceae bacterium]
MKEISDARRRIERLDWEHIEQSLDEKGYATTPALLTAQQCASLIALYPDRERFRKKVDMTRLRFGVGEYKYFADPLPPIVAELRAAFYPRLAPIANRWSSALVVSAPPLPSDLTGYLRYCADRGQTKPTPLMLRYEAGGYNCMHQDIYGEVVFPLQITVALSRREADYSGGEFLLLEDRPRAQARCSALTLERGEAVIFPSSFRPIRGLRGYYRARMRHGVSPLHRGLRYTLGIIFHNAA